MEEKYSTSPAALMKCVSCHAPNPRLMCGVCGALHFCSVECSDAIASLHAAVCHDKTSRNVEQVGKALEDAIVDMHVDSARYTPDQVEDALQVYEELHAFGDDDALDEAHAIIGSHLYGDVESASADSTVDHLLHSVASHRLLVGDATVAELELQHKNALGALRAEKQRHALLVKNARARLAEIKKQARAQLAPLARAERRARQALRARKRGERRLAKTKRAQRTHSRKASAAERSAARQERRLAREPIGREMPELIPL